MNKFKMPALLAAILTTAISLNETVITLAQTPPDNTVRDPQGFFQIIRDAIFKNINNVTTFILIPIGVLMIIINIILILWALVSGEKGNVGGKIGGIIAGFVLVLIGIAVSANRDNLFNP